MEKKETKKETQKAVNTEPLWAQYGKLLADREAYIEAVNKITQRAKEIFAQIMTIEKGK